MLFILVLCRLQGYLYHWVFSHFFVELLEEEEEGVTDDERDTRKGSRRRTRGVDISLVPEGGEGAGIRGGWDEAVLVHGCSSDEDEQVLSQLHVHPRAVQLEHTQHYHRI
jgi:hypothetical protein